MNGDRPEIEDAIAALTAAGMAPEDVEAAGVAALKVSRESSVTFADALHAMARVATEAANNGDGLSHTLNSERARNIGGTAVRLERRKQERAAAKARRKAAQ